MKVTFLGTTTLLFDDGSSQILFDAHVTRPGLGKIIRNTKLASNADLVKQLKEKYDITRLKGIFISHSHHDHVLDLVNFARDTDAMIYGSSSTLNVARGGGICEDRLIEFHDGFEITTGNYMIRVLKSKHSKPHLFNNNLGEEITEPLSLPASFRSFKEGGSFDFYLEYKNKRFIIRPSFNFINGQFDDLEADILFLGIGGMGYADHKTLKDFYRETIDKINPDVILPIHHDNFFADLHASFPASTKRALKRLEKYSKSRKIEVRILKPLDMIEWE